jgi:hypothetical protein
MCHLPAAFVLSLSLAPGYAFADDGGTDTAKSTLQCKATVKLKADFDG